jgi:hypothetical protein
MFRDERPAEASGVQTAQFVILEVAVCWRLIWGAGVCFVADTMISNRPGWRLIFGMFPGHVISWLDIFHGM